MSAGVNLWDLAPGDRVRILGGVVAEVVSPTEDGGWIKGRYLISEEAALIGTEDVFAEHEVVEHVPGTPAAERDPAERDPAERNPAERESRADAVEYGDKVEVVLGEHAGWIGWVTGLDKSDPYAPTVGIERDDGSIVRVPWDAQERVRKVEDPYAGGVAAKLSGEPVESNPYPASAPRRAEWAEGWRDSQADDDLVRRSERG